MTILAVHPGALGDVVLFGQLLDALRREHGGRIRLIAQRSCGELLAGLSVVDEALDFDALPMDEVFSVRPLAECRLPKQLGDCDLLVSCLADGDGTAQGRMTELTGATESLFLPVRPEAGQADHLVDLWAGAAGLTDVSIPEWPVPPAWCAQARHALETAGVDVVRPYVVIHPGSGGRDKCWPLDRFRELARGLRHRCVFIVGPVEREWWGGRALEAVRDELVLLVEPHLGVLAGILARAAAFVGNDSGPTHLSAAVGTPTVALFGPTDPRQFAPRGRRVATPAHRPLSELSVAAVREALMNV